MAGGSGRPEHEDRLARASADVHVGAEEGGAGRVEGPEDRAGGGGGDQLGSELEQGQEIQVRGRVFQGAGEGSTGGGRQSSSKSHGA